MSDVSRGDGGKWLPGQSANPTGRPPLTEDERLAYKNCKKAIAMVGTKTPKEIAEIANDPHALAIDKAVAKLLKDYFEKGNSKLIEMIFDRLIGKAQQQIEVTGADGSSLLNPLDGLPKDQRKQILQNLLKMEDESS